MGLMQEHFHMKVSYEHATQIQQTLLTSEKRV